jgi:predicted nucleic acid-binding protein
VICVDASVAVKWLLNEERSDRARALYSATLRTGETIIAPPLLPLEVTNILRQRMRAKDGLSLAEATAQLDIFLGLPIEYHNPTGLHRQALAIADSHDLPATHDAHYLALAEYLGCELWTDDQQLLRRVGSSLPFVRGIADYPATTGG